MLNLLLKLSFDEDGFVVSAELILVGTILILGMVVGLSELSYNVNEELEDAGSAVGRINQSYVRSGVMGHKARVTGSQFGDHMDRCDGEFDLVCDTGGVPERRKYGT